MFNISPSLSLSAFFHFDAFSQIKFDLRWVICINTHIVFSQKDTNNNGKRRVRKKIKITFLLLIGFILISLYANNNVRIPITTLVIMSYPQDKLSFLYVNFDRKILGSFYLDSMSLFCGKEREREKINVSIIDICTTYIAIQL
jgi:hypothetical protein